ncbi:MAG: hypothetical protein AB7P03_28305 [Kofleriaceae bacterium]
MWRIVVLFAVACASAPARHDRGDRLHTRPVPPGPMQLVFARTGAGNDVSTAAELDAALTSKREPTAALSEIVAITWGEHQLDRPAIQEIVDAYHDFPKRDALRERYGLADYDGVLRIVLHGYAAQLAQRFGIEPREVWAAPEKAQLRVGVRGLLGGSAVDWTAGAFSLSSAISVPPRTPRVPSTLETFVTSEGSHYYSVQNFGIAYFRPSDAPANNDKVHHGAVLRSYQESVEFLDANGVRYLTKLEVTRPTPYVISRPGGLPRTGLTKSIHLVRLELDARGVGSSAPIIESAKVLDGTPAFPADLEAACREIHQRDQAEARAAELALAAEQRAALASFDTRTKEWAKQMQPTGPVHSSERRYVQSIPTYSWDASTKTVTVTFAHETRVIHLKTIPYPNPELATFHCPPGAPCAVPPETLAHELRLEYVIAFTTSYRIQSDGKISRMLSTQPRLSVAR